MTKKPIGDERKKRKKKRDDGDVGDDWATAQACNSNATLPKNGPAGCRPVIPDD